MAAVAAVIAVFLAMPSILLHIEADYITGIADIRQIGLEDGTVMVLGASSAVALDFSGEDRTVKLLSGEAFFEVAPDASRPFIVSARDTITTVLGTAFDVQLLPDTVSIAVGHGEVGIAWSHSGVSHTAPSLGIGDWIEISGDGETTSGQMPPELVASWRNQSLVLMDRPLAEMVDTVRRYYGGTIFVTDDTLLSGRITGVYDLSDPEEALRAAVQVQGGQVQRITPWILLVNRG